jgi:hypothetical protein
MQRLKEFGPIVESGDWAEIQVRLFAAAVERSLDLSANP